MVENQSVVHVKWATPPAFYFKFDMLVGAAVPNCVSLWFLKLWWNVYYKLCLLAFLIYTLQWH